MLGGDPVDMFAKFSAERASGLAGREWVLEKIHDWLSDEDRPRVFVLTGDPGCGKTALAGHLNQLSLGAVVPLVGFASLSPGFLAAVHFCSARDRRWINPHAFTEFLALQLAGRFPVYAKALAATSSNREIRVDVRQTFQGAVEKDAQIRGVVIESLDVSGVKAEDAFLLVVREPLEVLARERPNDRFVILVDALDEALRYRGDVGIVPLVAEAEHLPANVLLLATTRPEDRVLAPLRRLGARTLPLTEGDGLNRSRGDVAQFARIRLTEEPELGPKLDPGLDVDTLVEAVQAKSEGNFLYVEYLLRGMLVQPGPIGLRSLDVWPAGLDGIYREFLERALPRPTPEQPKSPVIDTLAVAQEAVTEDQIARFTAAAVPSVRLVLSAIRQFLEVDETLPPRDRRFALYHQSFADFLLDGDRSDVWWCDQREHNGRLGQYYATTYRGRWEGSDDYGLRHVAYHLLNGPAGGLDRLADALDPSFIRTKVARFGSERSLLGDLDLALAAARTADDPALLLRFGWLHVGLRDRISQAVNAELLPFYVRLGQIERVLSMIDALDDRAGFYELAEKNDSRRQVAVELARRGSVDRAIEIVKAIPDDGARDRGLCEVAEQVALHDGHLALEIAARGHFAVITTEFCRRLAGHADLLDRSIELAAGRGPVLEAIALEVAHRDFDRALALIDTIEPYDDERYPHRTKGPDASRALLAIAETNRKPDRAVSLVDRLEDAGDVLIALIGIAGARATVDPRGALDFVDHYAARNREKGGLAAHMEYRLGLASIAAASENPEIQREVAGRRDEWHNRDLADPGYHRRAAGLSTALYVIGRLEWAAFRATPLAREIARATLDDVVAAFREHFYHRPYRDDATALAQDIGAALAVFDIDAAAEFVSWIPEALDVTNVAFRADQAGLLAAVTSAARFDPGGALRVIGRIEGYNSHVAHVAVARAVAAYDLPRALAIVDGVDPRYSHTKAAMLGVVGNQLDPADGDKVRMVLDRLPRYVTSEVFFYALFKAAAAVVEEMARHDWDAASALAHAFITRKIGGEEHKGRLLLALVEGGAASATDRAEALARTIADDQPRAQALLAVARHRAGATEKRVLLIEAMDALGDPQTAGVRRDRVFAGAIEELAGIDPWEALDRALRVSDFDRSVPLSAAIRAILPADGNTAWEPLARTLLAHPYERLSGFFEHLSNFQDLLDVLGPAGASDVLDWLEIRAPDLSRRLRAWHLAPDDPDAARGLLDQEEWDHGGWEMILTRRAPRDLDYAIAHFRLAVKPYEGHSPVDIGRILVDILKPVALRDPDRALEVVGRELREYESVKWAAVAALASVVAQRDWRRGFDIVGTIPDDKERDRGIVRVLQTLRTHPPQGNRTAAFEAGAAGAETIRRPSDRHEAFEALLDALRAAPTDESKVAAQVMVDLSHGERETFLKLLPSLIRLICKNRPGLSVRIADELTRIEELLSA